MMRRVTWSGVLCLLITASSADVFGQFNPYGNKANQNAAAADPRVRRAQREQAVAAIGDVARDFVETHGDEAVACIFACSTPVAVKLAEFHAAGEMAKFPRPRDLLRVIAQPRHCDDVALWAMQHARELTDRDCFDAYLLSPLEYALGLKSLAAGAAEARAWRLNQAANAPMPAAPWYGGNEALVFAGVAGFVVILALLIKRRKQHSVC
jgi:hypothetical protein